MPYPPRRPFLWRKALKFIWASPCTATGLVLGLVLLLAGAKAKWSAGALEVSYRANLEACGRLARRLPFRCIVFGHVILAVTREELDQLRPHERVHVEQYERWGPLFFPAYAAAGLWQLIRGRNPYWHNHFEVQARERGHRPASPQAKR